MDSGSDATPTTDTPAAAAVTDQESSPSGEQVTAGADVVDAKVESESIGIVSAAAPITAAPLTDSPADTPAPDPVPNQSTSLPSDTGAATGDMEVDAGTTTAATAAASEPVTAASESQPAAAPVPGSAAVVTDMDVDSGAAPTVQSEAVPSSEQQSQSQQAASGDATTRSSSQPQTQTSQSGKSAVVSSQSSQVAADRRLKVDSMPTRQYLDQTVVPILLQGLSFIAKSRPEDPIAVLAKYLMDHKSEHEPAVSATNLDAAPVNGSSS